MTPQESREIFVESVFKDEEVQRLKEVGLYNPYIYGIISIDELYAEIREQGI